MEAEPFGADLRSYTDDHTPNIPYRRIGFDDNGWFRSIYCRGDRSWHFPEVIPENTEVAH